MKNLTALNDNQRLRIMEAIEHLLGINGGDYTQTLIDLDDNNNEVLWRNTAQESDHQGRTQERVTV
jgi:hypothetical protein